MKELTIEWRHYEKEGATCLRCSTTGKALREVIPELRAELAPMGIPIAFNETKLTEAEIPESNMILFDGVPLEELLVGSEVSKNACPSCTCLTGTETSCRTIKYEADTHEAIPKKLIRTAVYKAIGIDEE